MAMKLIACFSTAVLLSLSASAFAGQSVPRMAPDASPSYEVATIKPGRPEEQKAVQVQGTRLATTATSLVDLMMFAYGVHQLQITSGADWTRTEKFDVLIQPDLPGRPSTAQMRSILQKLLADRFQLRFHHAQAELAVYRIVQAKGGAKLTPATASDLQTNTAAVAFTEGAMVVGNATLPEFASLMQRYVALDRPIVDHTGLTGKFDFKLSWTPDFSQFNGTPPWGAKPDETAAPSLYTAIQEQLGLKLEPAKELADTLVIDGVEKPSEN
jgi:uncharacterized protein (TIGR03435 family)